MNRTISFLALAAVIAVSAAPAFARDTRLETDRPTLEHPGGGDSDRGTDIEARLPKSSKGMRCHVGETRNGIAYVEVVNDTGKTIPAGSTVTIYTQPGNVQKLFTVHKDWQRGQTLDVPLKGVKFAEDETCAVRVSVKKPVSDQPQTPDEPTQPPTETPVEMPEVPPGPDSTPPVNNHENEYTTGDTGPIVDFGDGNVMSANCEVIAHSQVQLNNSGTVNWPVGTIFEVVLQPTGNVFTYVSGGVVPDGDIGIPLELLFPDGFDPDMGPVLPQDFTCQITVTLP